MDVKRSKVTTTSGKPIDENTTELKENGQQNDYVVLTEEERAKGFVRPVRCNYVHVGTKPRYPLRELTPEEKEKHIKNKYVAYEKYPESESPVDGMHWTQQQLDNKGCGGVTTMTGDLAETYARDPSFYGATFCVGRGKHLPVGESGEFIWDDDGGERVGT